MQRPRMLMVLLLVPVLMRWPAPPAYASDSTIKPEELLAHHLESIGSAEARASAKTRVVQGTAVYRILVGGGGRSQSKTGFVSEGHKLRWMVKLPFIDYRGENIVFDGNA